MSGLIDPWIYERWNARSGFPYSCVIHVRISSSSAAETAAGVVGGLERLLVAPGADSRGGVGGADSRDGVVGAEIAFCGGFAEGPGDGDDWEESLVEGYPVVRLVNC